MRPLDLTLQLLALRPINLKITVTSKTYKVRGKLCCTSSNVIYLISCKLCKEKCVGSAFKDNFKARFRVHRSDVINGKDRCGLAKHFLTKCTNGNKVANIKVQLIEQVQKGNYDEYQFR